MFVTKRQLKTFKESIEERLAGWTKDKENRLERLEKLLKLRTTGGYLFGSDRRHSIDLGAIERSILAEPYNKTEDGFRETDKTKEQPFEIQGLGALIAGSALEIGTPKKSRRTKKAKKK